MAARGKLDTYAGRRDFRKSPEPRSGGKSRWKKDRNPIFVVQEHDARSLHYDFRLEIDGVLKSWAVPKGPSTDPSRRRLAVETEDHPLSYADFEGVIPKGEYGGGTVLVWDAGPYRSLREDEQGRAVTMKAAYASGRIEVWLEGKKIRGGYALVRSHIGDDERHWLLVKMKDSAADARRNPVSTQPKSVLSGRTLRQIERDARA